MRAGYDICTGTDSKVTLNANIGYTYNFDDDAADGIAHWLGGQGTPTAMRTTGRDTGKHTLNLGAGIRYQYKRFDIGVNYDYYAKSKFDAHRVMATAGIGF